MQEVPCGFYPDGCGGELSCVCRVVANDRPAIGGGACVAPDYNPIQEAVDAASPGETIVICPGTYNLSAEVTVPIDLSFFGFDQETTIIDGANGGSGVQLFNADRLFLSEGRHVTFRGLTLRNGLTNEYGAAIAATTVEVTNSTFTGNTVRSDAQTFSPIVGGGAIAATVAFVRGCTFDGNVAHGSDQKVGVPLGGAIFAITLDVADSTFTNNHLVDDYIDFIDERGGGAIYGRDVEVRDSTFRHNSAMGTRSAVNGGAIFVTTNEAQVGHLTVVRSTFEDNTAYDKGGAIVAFTDAVLVESALARNTAYTGGAIAVEDNFLEPPPTLMVDRSTFEANASHGGGAIAGFKVVLTNSTFTNNVASDTPCELDLEDGTCCHGEHLGDPPRCAFGMGLGGAVAALQYVTATNCTFAGNAGMSEELQVSSTIRHGAVNYPDCCRYELGPVTLTNTILVGTPGTGVCSSFTDPWLIDGGGNFSADETCKFTQPISHMNVSAAALALAPLGDNGGPTGTMALLPGSVAKDAGVCAPDTDQRGRPRPEPGNTACDSGAYEVQAGAGTTCVADDDCESHVCDGVCKCPSHLYTFGATSNGGLFIQTWPGGTSTQSASPGCSVTVQNPTSDVSLTCGGGLPFSVLNVAGYSSCTGSGGKDGDGCSVTSCPPLASGSCCAARPACTLSIGGPATASFTVQCLQ